MARRDQVFRCIYTKVNPKGGSFSPFSLPKGEEIIPNDIAINALRKEKTCFSSTKTTIAIYN